MLQSIRKQTSSWVVRIFFVILIISFAVWGIGDIFRGGRDVAVASVGDAEIMVSSLNDAYRRERRQMQSLLPDNFEFEEAQKRILIERALDGMINRTLMDEAANDLGLKAGDAIIAEQLRNNKNFQDDFGRFSAFRFRETLRFNNLTEDAYLIEMRHELTRALLAETLVEAPTAPDVAINALYRFNRQKRALALLHADPEKISGIGTPDAETLAAYYQENGARFSRPEYRGVTLLRLTPEALAKEIDIAEEDLRAAYEAALPQYQTPARRKIQQVLLDDRESAAEAARRLEAGEDPLVVGRKLAGMDSDAVDLGWVRTGILPEPVDAVVFALEAGKVSAPVESSLGWHVVKILEAEAPRTTPFAKARDDLRAALAHEQAVESLYALGNTLEDTLAGGATLEEAAASLDLELVKIEAIDAAGKTPAGKTPVDFAQDLIFLQQVFGTEQGNQSPLTETGGGNYFVLRIDTITAATVPPLDTIQKKVAAAWSEDQRQKEARSRAKKAQERLAAGENPAAVARALSLSFEVTAPLDLAGAGRETALPPAALDTLYSSSPAAIDQTAIMAETPKGPMAARVQKILPLAETRDPAQMATVRDEMVDCMAIDLLIQFTKALRQRYPVEVNRRAVDTLL